MASLLGDRFDRYIGSTVDAATSTLVRSCWCVQGINPVVPPILNATGEQGETVKLFAALLPGVAIPTLMIQKPLRL